MNLLGPRRDNLSFKYIKHIINIITYITVLQLEDRSPCQFDFLHLIFLSIYLFSFLVTV